MTCSCYLCHRVPLGTASYRGLCIRHRVMLLWRLFCFLMSRRELGNGVGSVQRAYVSQMEHIDHVLTSQLAAVQQLQILLTDTTTTVTLHDVVVLAQTLQQAYGERVTLEAVIQRLVERHLKLQVAHRRGERKNLEQEAVA